MKRFWRARGPRRRISVGWGSTEPPAPKNRPAFRGFFWGKVSRTPYVLEADQVILFKRGAFQYVNFFHRKDSTYKGIIAPYNDQLDT